MKCSFRGILGIFFLEGLAFCFLFKSTVQEKADSVMLLEGKEN